MRVVVQRVRRASVRVGDEVVGAIEAGLLLLVGIGPTDSREDLAWMADKIANLRILDDDDGRMNVSTLDVLAREKSAAFLVVSQFTLFADVRKGRRPSFVGAAAPEHARQMMLGFEQEIRARKVPVQGGVFGAEMLITLENDGPVTIWIDSEEQRPR